jgi:hypothetical protein
MPQAELVRAGSLRESTIEREVLSLLEGQHSLGWRQREPLTALPGSENDGSLVSIEWVAVRVGLAPGTGLGCGGDVNGPGSGVALEYSFDFYEVGRGLVTVDAGFAGLAYRLPD